MENVMELSFQLPEGAEFPEDWEWAVGDKVRVRPDYVKELSTHTCECLGAWHAGDENVEFKVVKLSYNRVTNDAPRIELQRPDKTRFGMIGVLAFQFYRTRRADGSTAKGTKASVAVSPVVTDAPDEIDAGRFGQLG